MSGEDEQDAARCAFCELHNFCWCSDDAAVQQAPTLGSAHD